MDLFRTKKRESIILKARGLTMEIRRAQERDIPRIKELLEEVLNIHAKGRPDLFIPNTTKYTDEELKVMVADDTNPIFVCVNEQNTVLGYAMCQLKKRVHDNNMTDIQTIFIDDLCVDEAARHQKIGQQLFTYVKQYAKEIGCYNVTLNVWSFNEKAIGFYEAMGLQPMETVMEVIL